MHDINDVVIGTGIYVEVSSFAYVHGVPSGPAINLAPVHTGQLEDVVPGIAGDSIDKPVSDDIFDSGQSDPCACSCGRQARMIRDVIENAAFFEADPQSLCRQRTQRLRIFEFTGGDFKSVGAGTTRYGACKVDVVKKNDVVIRAGIDENGIQALPCSLMYDFCAKIGDNNRIAATLAINSVAAEQITFAICASDLQYIVVIVTYQGGDEIACKYIFDACEPVFQECGLIGSGPIDFARIKIQNSLFVFRRKVNDEGAAKAQMNDGEDFVGKRRGIAIPPLISKFSVVDSIGSALAEIPVQSARGQKHIILRRPKESITVRGTAYRLDICECVLCLQVRPAPAPAETSSSIGSFKGRRKQTCLAGAQVEEQSGSRAFTFGTLEE